VADSLAISRGVVVAVGNGLQHDRDFRAFPRINLRGKAVVPGFVDAHTHFYMLALSLEQVSLDGVDSFPKCLAKIKAFAAGKPRGSWIVGSGLTPEHFPRREEPDRYVLDNAVGGRPAFIFYKDTHSAWVSSRALAAASISKETLNPDGGQIVRFPDGSPTGLLREKPAYDKVFELIPLPTKRAVARLYDQALALAYQRGVTGVHSMDGPEAFEWFSSMVERGRVGLRINYYPSERLLDQLERTNTRYGTATPFFRIAGVKVFADGALGSQTALCFHKYTGSRDNYGIEVTSVAAMKRMLRRAARLALPCATHAIGDRGVSNVLDAMETCPAPKSTRHRIEHLQLVRRKDLLRVKRLAVVASMQPSHCPSDMYMVRKYWCPCEANAYVFRSVIDRQIPLAFGSDAPIEPLNPLAGIADAVRRARPGSRDVFHPEQRITAVEALHAFTVGPAIASGQESSRGRLLPGFPADLVVLSQDITRVAPMRLCDTKVVVTIIDGTVCYTDGLFKW